MKKYFRVAGKLGFVLWLISFVTLIIFYIKSAVPQKVQNITVGGLEWWGHLYYIVAIILDLILGPAVCLLLIHVGNQKDHKTTPLRDSVTTNTKTLTLDSTIEDKPSIRKTVNPEDYVKIKYYHMTKEVLIYNNSFTKYFEIGKITDFQSDKNEVSFVYSFKTYEFVFESIEDVQRLQKILKL